MSVTVRKRLPRFVGGGTMAPSSTLTGATTPLTAGGGGAGGLIGQPINNNTPSVGAIPINNGGSGSSSASPISGPGDGANPRQSTLLGSISAGSYTPPSMPTGPSYAPVSNGFSATAQGLPKGTNNTGFEAGPESTAQGKWGAAAQSGIQGDQNGAIPASWSPGTYQRPGTMGNYGSYFAQPGAPQPGRTPPANPLLLAGSPNYAGGGAVNMDEGGAVPSFRRGGHAGGGFSGVGVPSAVDVGGGSSSNGADARAFHQADTVGRINQYYSQEKPVQDAIAAGHAADQQNAQAAQPTPQPQQQRQPQQRRAAGGGMHMPQARQQQQQSNDNSLMQKLVSQMGRPMGAQAGVGTDVGGSNAGSLPSVQSDAGAIPDSSGAGPTDQGGVPTDAMGMVAGGPVKFASGGAMPGQGARDPLQGVRAAFSHARRMNGLNDQVFQQIASGLHGQPPGMASGGSVDPRLNIFDNGNDSEDDGDDDDKKVNFAAGGAMGGMIAGPGGTGTPVKPAITNPPPAAGPSLIGGKATTGQPTVAPAVKSPAPAPGPTLPAKPVAKAPPAPAPAPVNRFTPPKRGGMFFECGGAIPGMEDVASEDLPYKCGPGAGEEDLKGEAQGKYDG